MDSSSAFFPAASNRRAAFCCRFCSEPSLRRSRIRPLDFMWIVILHWPVRCLRCSKRQYVVWTHARYAISWRAPHAPELRQRESWRHFTSVNEAAAVERNLGDDR